MKQTKRFAVVGSDARQAAAGRALARVGYTVGGVQQLPQADYILLPLPLEQSGLPLAQLLFLLFIQCIPPIHNTAVSKTES